MAGIEKKDAKEVSKELGEMAGSKNKDAREVSEELEVMAASEKKDAREVSKELEEMAGTKNKDEREINRGPNPFRSYDIEFTEYGERLGKGADGATFSCINKFDLGIYVVKKIPFNCNSEDRVKREVQALAALQHSHVMQYFQAWVEDFVAVELHSSEEDDEDIDQPTKTCFIILETCPSSLRYEMENELVTRKKAYAYFHQILEGVQHLHNKGWIHRDLTRDNIFLDTFGKIKIGDFSLAMEPSKGIDPAEDGRVGKEFYRAPEISSVHVGPAADIFSLGVLLFEMLYPMTTESERYRTLTNLMNKVFPEEMDVDPRVTGLIKEMLDTYASRRPSLSDIATRFQWKLVAAEDIGVCDAS